MKYYTASNVAAPIRPCENCAANRQVNQDIQAANSKKRPWKMHGHMVHYWSEGNSLRRSFAERGIQGRQPGDFGT